MRQSYYFLNSNAHKRKIVSKSNIIQRKKFETMSLLLATTALSACGSEENATSVLPAPTFSLTGNAIQGSLLTVNLSDLDITENSVENRAEYKWYRDDVVVTDRMQNDTYELLQEDVGSQIDVIVNIPSVILGLDGSTIETIETYASFETAFVQNVNDPALGSLQLSGGSTAGSKLTVSAVAISDDDGLGAFDFSWFRNGQEITNFKTWQNDPVDNVEVKHLVMGDGEIQMRKETAGPEAVLKVIILQGGVEVTHTVEPTADNPTGRVTVDSAQPADWQTEIMQSVIAKIPEYIDLSIDLVNTIDEADITIFVHPLPNQDQLNGFNGQFQGSKLIMSYQTGLQNGKHLETDMALLNTYWNEQPELRKDWEEIFIHELGHLLGLEHPWDMKDGDTDQAVTSSDQPHTHTLMGYSNTGEEGWFTDIDLAALQSIWGNSNASKDQFEVYEADIGDEIYAQVTFIDGGGNLETIVSDTMAIIA